MKHRRHLVHAATPTTMDVAGFATIDSASTTLSTITATSAGDSETLPTLRARRSAEFA
jgi:hypothetical protein